MIIITCNFLKHPNKPSRHVWKGKKEKKKSMNHNTYIKKKRNQYTISSRVCEHKQKYR